MQEPCTSQQEVTAELNRTQFEFADWTRDNHLHHGRFASLTG